MSEIFFLVLPVFIVLATGNLLKRMKIVDDRFIASSNTLIFKVTLPALLFLSISRSNLKAVFDWRLVAIIFASVFLVAVLSFITAKILRLSPDITGTFAMNNFRGNYANMGLPVFFYVFGQEGLMYASVLMAFIVPYVSMLAIIGLSLTSGDRTKIAPMMKNAVLNPLAIACMGGLLYSYIGIPMPAFINKSISIISDVTLPLALFCVGSTITLESMKNDFFLSSLSSFFKMLVGPAIAFFMLKAWGIEMTIGAKALVVLLSSPSGTVNYVFAAAMGGNTRLTASTIVTTHSFSILTFIMWIMIVGV
ncbi:AEC family transporter [Geovibrio ferrireducens]|jgi:hypothetical protein|uniref:AEC family transporter n=1 Tax=Geovibrio ferrireducens TaxID=46201 RepID=UPI002245B6B7|nr:AEC family transporter [Geovibrio ferrireducens]